MFFRKLLNQLNTNSREKKIYAIAWLFVIVWFGLFILMMINWNDLPTYVRLLLIPMLIFCPDYHSMKDLVKGEFTIQKTEKVK